MPIPTRVRFGVFERCNFACFYCGLPAQTGVIALQVDHVLPQALGGTDDPWNLVAACQPCNLGKTDHAPADPVLKAAADLYWSWPGRSRALGRCSDCGRIWVLSDDELEAGPGENQQCWPCISAWVTGHEYSRRGC